MLWRNRKSLSKIFASCFSKIKKPNKYCLGNQTKFLIFLRKKCDCMVVDPYKARKSLVLYGIIFLQRKSSIFLRNYRDCNTLNFPPQQQNWHNRTTVLYTKYVHNTKNYFPPESKKLTQHHNCMVFSHTAHRFFIPTSFHFSTYAIWTNTNWMFKMY